MCGRSRSQRQARRNRRPRQSKRSRPGESFAQVRAVVSVHTPRAGKLGPCNLLPQMLSANESARGRSPWRLHIVMIRRSVAVPSSGSRLRRTQTLCESLLLANQLPPSLPIEPESFRLAVRGCAGYPNAVPTGSTGWQPSGLHPSAHFRLGLSERYPGLRRRTEPSAPGAAANSGSRLCSTLRHRPAGNPRLTPKTHLPARLVRTFAPRSDFCLRLAPPVSIRTPRSRSLRNCTRKSAFQLAPVFASLAVPGFQRVARAAG